MVARCRRKRAPSSTPITASSTRWAILPVTWVRVVSRICPLPPGGRKGFVSARSSALSKMSSQRAWLWNQRLTASTMRDYLAHFSQAGSAGAPW